MIRRRSRRFTFGACLLLTASLGLSGCHTFRHTECRNCEAVEVPAPVPIGAPGVQVVGLCSSAQEQYSQMFVTEIQSSLGQLGGLRLLESPCALVSCEDRACDVTGVVRAVAKEKHQNNAVRTASFTQAAIPPELISPFDGEKLQVTVRIDELIAYSPMRMSATITVMSATTGEVRSVIQKTWLAPDEAALHPKRRWFAFWTRHQSPTPEALQNNAMRQLSPVTLLRTAAREVAPAVHAACVVPVSTMDHMPMDGTSQIIEMPVSDPPAIESIPSVPPESPPSL